MPAKEIPNWVETTPPDHRYSIIMFESDDQGVEEVDLTRVEYIALKAHLAAMRGYTVGDFRARIADLAVNGPEGYSRGDEQQIAAHMETARDFYRSCPDLVVLQSEEFDELLAELADAGVSPGD